nr:MAG TPA: hypothetical protein [Bacteriophage sp.]
MLSNHGNLIVVNRIRPEECTLKEKKIKVILRLLKIWKIIIIPYTLSLQIVRILMRLLKKRKQFFSKQLRISFHMELTYLHGESYLKVEYTV